VTLPLAVAVTVVSVYTIQVEYDTSSTSIIHNLVLLLVVLLPVDTVVVQPVASVDPS
jgi:Mn2+/Fe2+ NRAMP family transporter